MERDNGQTTALAQDTFGRFQTPVQFAQFIVDVNAKRLKRPRRRINAVLGLPHDGAHHTGQRSGTRDRRLAALGDNRTGHTTGMAFLAEIAN